MGKFIIFANARTGSTSLARLLGECPGVRMSIEPFHEKYIEWNPNERNYHAFIKDEATLNAALMEIFSKYTALKCLDYQFDENIYFKLLRFKDTKALFLIRKNTVMSAISNLVAKQTNAWHKNEAEKMGYSIYDKLEPIQIKEIKQLADSTQAQDEKYEAFLKKNKTGGFMQLYYEDLYSASKNQNLKTIQNICDFLGLTLPPDEAIEKYMNPKSAQISLGGVYRKIPNIKEIEDYFKIKF